MPPVHPRGPRDAAGKITAALLALALSLALAGCSKISAENYAKIEKGMTYGEVVAILGEPTDKKSVGVGPLSGTAATWTRGSTEIEIKFINDKVQLSSLDTEAAP